MLVCRRRKQRAASECLPSVLSKAVQKGRHRVGDKDNPLQKGSFNDEITLIPHFNQISTEIEVFIKGSITHLKHIVIFTNVGLAPHDINNLPSSALVMTNCSL